MPQDILPEIYGFMTKRIGLTGGIACGKSEVTNRLRQHGIPVLDSDQVAHEILKPDNPVFRAVVNRFGKEILDPQGNIDRSLLGRKVFAVAGERQALNRLMHPEIQNRWRSWLDAQTGELAVVAVPLLFEICAEQDFDGILCIWSPESVMIQRLKNRNLTETEAVQRIQAQMSVDLKAEKSTWTLINTTTLADLYQQVDEWVKPWIPQEN